MFSFQLEYSEGIEVQSAKVNAKLRGMRGGGSKADTSSSLPRRVGLAQGVGLHKDCFYHFLTDWSFDVDVEVDLINIGQILKDMPLFQTLVA